MGIQVSSLDSETTEKTRRDLPEQLPDRNRQVSAHLQPCHSERLPNVHQLP